MYFSELKSAVESETLNIVGRITNGNNNGSINNVSLVLVENGIEISRTRGNHYNGKISKKTAYKLIEIVPEQERNEIAEWIKNY